MAGAAAGRQGIHSIFDLQHRPEVSVLLYDAAVHQSADGGAVWAGHRLRVLVRHPVHPPHAEPGLRLLLHGHGQVRGGAGQLYLLHPGHLPGAVCAVLRDLPALPNVLERLAGAAHALRSGAGDGHLLQHGHSAVVRKEAVRIPIRGRGGHHHAPGADGHRPELRHDRAHGGEGICPDPGRSHSNGSGGRNTVRHQPGQGQGFNRP